MQVPIGGERFILLVHEGAEEVDLTRLPGHFQLSSLDTSCSVQVDLGHEVVTVLCASNYKSIVV